MALNKTELAKLALHIAGPLAAAEVGRLKELSGEDHYRIARDAVSIVQCLFEEAEFALKDEEED